MEHYCCKCLVNKVANEGDTPLGEEEDTEIPEGDLETSTESVDDGFVDDFENVSTETVEEVSEGNAEILQDTIEDSTSIEAETDTPLESNPEDK